MQISGSVDQNLWCTVTISDIDYYGYLRGWAGQRSPSRTLALNDFDYVQPYSGSYEFSFDVSAYQGQTIIIRAALYDTSTYEGLPTHDAEDTLYISNGGGGGYDPGEDDETINVSHSATNSSITCYITLTGFSSVHHISIVLYRDSHSHTEPSDTPNSSQNIYTTSGSVTFESLPADNYRIWIYVFATSNGSSIASQAYPSRNSWIAISGTSKPDYWYWNSSTLRRNAYNALINKTATTNFSYSVWNELCDKVSEVRVASGNSTWNSYYLTLAKTKMTSSDKILTATRYNSLRYNIGSIYTTGINEVSTGDKVYGQTHFLNLTNKINEWIDAL